jgi:hypothetical protein
MTTADEAAFLAPFVTQVEQGETVEIANIKDSLELRLGRPIPLASVYNLLNRHGWQRNLATKKRENKEPIGPRFISWRLAKHVNIINIDSKLPNLATEKIRLYYQQKGFTVISRHDMAGKIPTFVSLLFEFNRHKVARYEGLPDVTIGGTGYDLKMVLPSEIDAMRPKVNVGYVTRGCLRRCPWCHVSSTDGGIRQEATIYDIWDGKNRELTLLDDNILQAPDAFRELCRDARKEGILIDINQGLDFRLIDDDVARELENIRMKDVRLALDTPDLISTFREKLTLLRRYRIRRDPLTYVLVGFNTSWEQDMERIEFLRDAGCRPYVQRYKTVRGDSRYAVLAEWVNQFWPVQTMSFDEFEKLRRERPDRRRKER